MSKKYSGGSDPPAGPRRAGAPGDDPSLPPEQSGTLPTEMFEAALKGSALPFVSGAPAPGGAASPWAYGGGQEAVVAQAEVPWAPPPIQPWQPDAAAPAAAWQPDAAAPAAAIKAARPTAQVSQLLWYDVAQAERVRSVKRWSSLLDEAEERPADGEAAALDATAAGLPEDHRDIFEIIARGAAVDRLELGSEIRRAFRDDGKYIPPLVLLDGDLRVSFDPQKTLQIATDLAGALAADEQLDSLLEQARKLRDSTAAGIHSVVDRQLQDLRRAFSAAARALPADFLMTETERLLVRERAYEIHSVLGGDFLHAALTIAGSRAPQTAYLPVEVAKLLPLRPAFRVRLIAEAHQPQDEASAAFALKTVALALVLAGSARGR